MPRRLPLDQPSMRSVLFVTALTAAAAQISVRCRSRRCRSRSSRWSCWLARRRLAPAWAREPDAVSAAWASRGCRCLPRRACCRRGSAACSVRPEATCWRIPIAAFVDRIARRAWLRSALRDVGAGDARGLVDGLHRRRRVARAGSRASAPVPSASRRLATGVLSLRPRRPRQGVPARAILPGLWRAARSRRATRADAGARRGFVAPGTASAPDRGRRSGSTDTAGTFPATGAASPRAPHRCTTTRARHARRCGGPGPPPSSLKFDDADAAARAAATSRDCGARDAILDLVIDVHHQHRVERRGRQLRIAPLAEARSGRSADPRARRGARSRRALALHVLRRTRCRSARRGAPGES